MVRCVLLGENEKIGGWKSWELFTHMARYGLNDQVKGKNSTSSIGSLFFPLLRYTNRPNIRKRYKSSILTQTKTPQELYDEISK